MYTIYLIINLQNNKIYVGSSIYFVRRKCTHLSSLRRGVHYNYKLQKDFNLFGEEWFVIRPLKSYDNITYEQLLDKEQVLLDTLKPEYNIAKNVEQPYIGRKHSEETKQKIREANTGIIFTKERKQRISEKAIGRKGKPLSKSMKDRLRNMRVSKSVNQYDLNDNLIQSFPSLKEASRVTKINHGNISSCCNPNLCNKTAGGYVWKWST